MCKQMTCQTGSLSSCHAIRTDIPDPLSLQLPWVYCFRQILSATSRIDTELLYVGSSWSSCLFSSMWRGSRDYITYEFVPTSPAVSRMSGLSNFDSVFVMGGRWPCSCCFVKRINPLTTERNAWPGSGRRNLTLQRPGSLVRTVNYCCSSIRVASEDENKNSHRKITMTHTETTCLNRIALRAGKKKSGGASCWGWSPGLSVWRISYRAQTKITKIFNT